MIETTPLPSPSQIISETPLSQALHHQIASHRQSFKSIFHRTNAKIALIVGPCSIHNIESALIYAQKLYEFSKEVEDTIFIVMRAYIEKPRTTTGWKGILYDPYVNGTNDMEQGIRISRSILKEIAQIGLPLATEFLDPLVSLYFSDLITWGSIGARTSSSPIHRQFASGLSMPIGFKNAVDGNLDIPLQSLISARTSHDYFTVDIDGKIASSHSSGNLYTHLVLRGSVNGPNYTSDHIEMVIEKQKNIGIHSPILIDCAHDNSNKIPSRQEAVFRSVMHHILQDRSSIFGLMLESFLEEGGQPIDLERQISPNLSITDPCLGWEETKELLLWASDILSKSSFASCPT